ncbi:DUF11 domain-containing protein [Candidatus Parcubacteria bacterium]|nr:MAG: DUF11 domain-containing protein [Candidatus Parcubacteria bacterium]
MTSFFKKNKNTGTAKDNTVKNGLVYIYKDENGNLPDISRLEIKKKSKMKNYFLSGIILTGLIGAGIFFGYRILTGGNGYRGKSLDIEITAPNKISSGDSVNYKIKYRNNENYSLNNVELFVRFPDNFKFVSSEPSPANDFKTLWKLENLNKNAQAEMIITGIVIGQVGTELTFDLTMAFEPENFSSTFKETASFTQTIESTIIDLEITGPETVLPEKKVVYTVKYKNNSDKELGRTQVEAIYPETFVFQKSEPANYVPKENEGARKLNNLWRFEKLEPNFEGEIKIDGGYVSDDNEEEELTIKIGFLDEENNLSVQQEKKITTRILKTGLEAGLLVNGTDIGSPVNMGDTLNFMVNLKNAGSNDLNGVVLEFKIDPELVDWQAVSGTVGEIDKKSGVIRWTETEIAELSQFKPGTEKQLEFALKLKEYDEVDIKGRYEIKSQVKAKIQNINDIEADTEIFSNETANIINSQLSLKAEGRYFDDDNQAVGTGPLPPVVGEKTTFRIYWAIANSLNEVKNVEVTATLPEGVEFTEKFIVNAGKLMYNDNSKTMTWTVSKISSNMGYDDVNLWFDVEIAPTVSNKGRIMVLLTETELVAYDTRTGDEILQSQPAVTTNLDADPVARGKGIIVGFE